jgi:hypothetical protein
MQDRQADRSSHGKRRGRKFMHVLGALENLLAVTSTKHHILLLMSSEWSVQEITHVDKLLEASHDPVRAEKTTRSLKATLFFQFFPNHSPK